MLLPVGTELSTETLDALISSHKTGTYQSISLMQYGTVKEDLLGFLSVHPYQMILPDQEHIADHLKDMENVHLTTPILQSMNYFKQHDIYSYRHFLTVFALSTLLAKDLVPDYKKLTNLVATGPTHDIGKICVPLQLLKKTTPLTRSAS
jgi:HD-GYP domain-containing protein (c-di-GMP phosphodiesterase class II)